jgi:hypothetical protein
MRTYANCSSSTLLGCMNQNGNVHATGAKQDAKQDAKLDAKLDAKQDARKAEVSVYQDALKVTQLRAVVVAPLTSACCMNISGSCNEAGITICMEWISCEKNSFQMRALAWRSGASELCVPHRRN